MSDNSILLQKADLALADLASGGRLSPEQSNKFIRTVIDEPTILNSARVVTMAAPTRKINKIGFGTRIMQAAPASGTALADNKRSKPSLGQIELVSKELIAEVHLPYDVLEDNIEGGNPFTAAGTSAGGLMDTLIQMIGARAALDLEEWALLGDTTSNDAYLALNDGWLKRANVNTGTVTGSFSKDHCKQALLTMPTPYLRQRNLMRFYTSIDNETEIRDKYANRATQLGDSSLQNADVIKVFGSPVAPAALMPNSKLLFTNPLNLIFGIQRNISMEFDKDIRSRQYIIVLTCRVDSQIEETAATVRLDGINT